MKRLTSNYGSMTITFLTFPEQVMWEICGASPEKMESRQSGSWGVWFLLVGGTLKRGKMGLFGYESLEL